MNNNTLTSIYWFSSLHWHCSVVSKSRDYVTDMCFLNSILKSPWQRLLLQRMCIYVFSQVVLTSTCINASKVFSFVLLQPFKTRKLWIPPLHFEASSSLLWEKLAGMASSSHLLPNLASFRSIHIFLNSTSTSVTWKYVHGLCHLSADV